MSLPSNVHVSTHPCLRAKLSQLRSHATNAKETRGLINDIATIVACEALGASLKTTQSGTDKSPLGYEYAVDTISPASISIVPILRSGLGMVDAVCSLLPSPVPIHHLGLYREKTTLDPVEYYNNLPYHRPTEANPTASGPCDLAIIVDPVIATGATACAAIDTLKDWGVHKIIMLSVLSSEHGLKRAAEEWSEGVEIWTGGCDKETDSKGMIKPGLGDVGDRLFLTLGK
ncbi:uracil phosphoribosyltransferas-like protein [Patellaria atrata CBS 101060]|uniref:uracil phosphoribosyltransferase n=1 Tax=Patellaria atrata CBS 101060 TaxID=1346257 RepID=A0A9P4VNT4_9PEZI|nr:uracil phosphoribosyltransferas-like protein [Patellaria atrata CBS 101060]